MRFAEVSSPQEPLTSTDELLAGRYHLYGREVADSSNAGTLAFDVDEKRYVIVRRLSGAYEAVLAAEARRLAAFQHPGLQKILEVGQDEAGVFAVVEWAAGESLPAFVAREALGAERIHAFSRQALMLLADAHDLRWFHPCLTPERFFIPSEAATADFTVKLLDFGVLGSHAKPGDFPFEYYLPPEQRAGKPVDAAANLYSFAAVLFYAITRTHPEPAQLVAPAAGMPESIAGWLSQAFSPDPLKRPLDARAMLRGLDAAIEGMSGHTANRIAHAHLPGRPAMEPPKRPIATMPKPIARAPVAPSLVANPARSVIPPTVRPMKAIPRPTPKRTLPAAGKLPAVGEDKGRDSAKTRRRAIWMASLASGLILGVVGYFIGRNMTFMQKGTVPAEQQVEASPAPAPPVAVKIFDLAALRRLDGQLVHSSGTVVRVLEDRETKYRSVFFSTTQKEAAVAFVAPDATGNLSTEKLRSWVGKSVAVSGTVHYYKSVLYIYVLTPADIKQE